MARAVASVSSGGLVSVQIVSAPGSRTQTTEAPHSVTTTAGTTETTVKDTSPLEIPTGEIGWSLGSFAVLLVLMRTVLYPRVARGMKARADHIAKGLTDADATRAASQADVKAYDAKLAEIRAEAAAKVDAARAQVERERTEAVAAAGKGIAELRTAAAAQANETRQSVSGSVVDAASDVVATATQMLIGTVPDSATVRSAVSSVMEATT